MKYEIFLSNKYLKKHELIYIFKSVKILGRLKERKQITL